MELRNARRTRATHTGTGTLCGEAPAPTQEASNNRQYHRWLSVITVTMEMGPGSQKAKNSIAVQVSGLVPASTLNFNTGTV